MRTSNCPCRSPTMHSSCPAGTSKRTTWATGVEGWSAWDAQAATRPHWPPKPPRPPMPPMHAVPAASWRQEERRGDSCVPGSTSGPSGSPEAAHGGPRRPTAAHGGPRRPTRPTAAHGGPERGRAGGFATCRLRWAAAGGPQGGDRGAARPSHCSAAGLGRSSRPARARPPRAAGSGA